jgi:hypothetical protein
LDKRVRIGKRPKMGKTGHITEAAAPIKHANQQIRVDILSFCFSEEKDSHQTKKAKNIYL